MAQASVRLSKRRSVFLSMGVYTKLVNTIQTEPFQLGPSNLIHIPLMTRGRHLFDLQGQGHTLDIVVKPCNHVTD